MAQHLSSIKHFTEILNELQFGNQDEDTKNKLQEAISSLIRQAQERCVLKLAKMDIKEKISRQTLKEQARKLMHNELQELIRGKDFLDKCRNIIAESSNILSPIQIKKRNIQSNKSSNNKSDGTVVKQNDVNIQQLKPLFDKVAKRLNSEDYRQQSATARKDVNQIQKQVPPDPKQSKLLKTSQSSTKIQRDKSKSNTVMTRKISQKSLNNTNNKTTPLENSNRNTTNPQTSVTTVLFNKPKPIPKRNSQSPLGSKLSINIIPSIYGSEFIKFQKIKESVDIAIKQRKTFMMLTFGLIRRALCDRGWVEKIVVNRNHPTYQQIADRMSMTQLFHSTEDLAYGDFYLRLLKSKLLGSNQCDLLWGSRAVTTGIAKCIRKPVWLNHFARRGNPDFTSKVGLCKHMRNLRWNYRQGISDVHFPRTYILYEKEWDDFIYDFRITACLALLKWSISRASANQPLISKTGKLPIDAFFFAILQCIGFIKRQKDCEFKLSYSLQTWNNFIEHYYQCIYLGEHFRSRDGDNVADLVAQASQVVEHVKAYRPELEFDGNNNIWILKPNNWSRGYGIHVCRRMDKMKELVSKSPHLRYVVQKYIEKPLLIYNTKFDIRQWFLISCSVPLTVWIYKDSYLRFSSQQYDLTRFHESIHLTNNSVQCKYKNNSARSSYLPKDNMWDSNQFQHYLRTTGHPNVWRDTIYPKMKQAIVAVLLSAKDNIEDRPYTFELFGADFMLTPDFQPWLIEINSCPAMSPTTSITARMCPEVNEDMAKVVIDGINSPKGKFELLFKDKVPNTLATTNKEGFFLKGTPLSQQYYKLINETMKLETDTLKNTQSSLLSLSDIDKKMEKIVNKSVYWTKLQETPSKITDDQLAVPDDIEQNIKITKKVVHMKSILKIMKDILKKNNRIKVNLEKNENLVGNKIIPYFKKLYEERNIEDIIDDIEKTVVTINKNNSVAECQSDSDSIICQRTLLKPKTIKNIILSLTLTLYLRSNAQLMKSEKDLE